MGLSTYAAMAQTTNLPSVSSAAFATHLSSPNELVYTSSQLSVEAFHKFCKLDSVHQVFPEYLQYRGLHATRNAIGLSVWNSSFMNQSTGITQECSFMLSQVDSLSVGTYSLFIEPNVHSVWGDLPVISVNVNDEGWMNYSSSMSVTIPDLAQSCRIAVSYSLNGEMRETGVEIPVMRKSDLLLTATPWPVNAGTNYEVSVWYGNQEMKANTYVRVSDDGLFDKPFIFVEGIDFGRDHSETRNGRFGWENFTRAQDNDDYQNLDDLPGMLVELYQHGYDVVLVDFYDGAADIRANAAVVQQVIRLCNQYKVGTEPNVVAGASMGGIVSRIALREMELHDEAHCTRLYISVDAPHLGAYIPVALQSTIDFFSDFSGAAEDFVSNALTRPAAKQLLIYQWFTSNREHPADYVNFQHYLDEIGFPEKTRNIAIANGNAQEGLDYDAGSELMNVHCNVTGLLSGDEFRCVMYPLPGSSNYTENTSWSSVISDNKYTEVDISWLGVEAYMVSGAQLFSNTAKPYDYANGGYSSSIEEFVEALNATADFTGNCGQINADQFKTRHCFVPTYSALAMSDRTVFEDVSNGTTPFANYKVALSGNEEHTNLSYHNLQFIAHEVMGMEYDNGQSVWQDAVTNHWDFNFGSSGDQQLPCTEIANMVVSIGELGNTYNDGNSQIDEGNTCVVELYGECGSTILDMQLGSTLQVGTEGGTVNAELVVVDGTTLVMEAGSNLLVHPGGTLRIQSGGVLLLNGGDAIMNGTLILESGARMQWNGGSFLMAEENAQWIFDGGKLKVTSGNHAVLSLQQGQVKFNANQLSRIEINANASLECFGMGALSLFTLEHGAHVIVDGGGQFLKLDDVRLDFESETRWNSSVFTQVFDSNINGAAGAKWDQSYSGMTVYDSELSQLAVHVLKGKLNWSGVYATQGTQTLISYGNMNVFNCSFDGSELVSEYLLTIGKIAQSNFSHTTNAYSDNSLVDVNVEQCTFSNNGIGVQKKGGKLNVRCSQFTNHQQAITLGKGTVLNMSSANAAGYNSFSNSLEHIHFYHAGTPQLSKGFNVFSGATQYNLVGNIATISCGLNCLAPSLNTASNNFGVVNGGMGISLYTSSLCNNGQVCPIGVSPNSNYEFPCPATITQLSAGKSMAKGSHLKTLELPMVSTTEFGVLALDSALSMAASKVFELVDSSYNYKGALKALHEILVQPLDRMDPAVRKLCEWGMMQMKNNVEEMVMQNKVNLNGANFDVTTQYYVDVLNANTDSELTDSTFRSQFWIELSKAQLFRTLNNPAMALYIMDELNTCNLEGDELQELLFWKNLTQDELNLISNVGVVVNDSVYAAVNDNQFHFGVHIYSPNVVAFESCFNAVKQNMEEVGFMVQPTRNDGVFEAVSASEMEQLEVFDLMGRTVYQTTSIASSRMNVRLEVESGLYLVRVKLHNGIVLTTKMEVLR